VKFSGICGSLCARNQAILDEDLRHKLRVSSFAWHNQIANDQGRSQIYGIELFEVPATAIQSEIKHHWTLLLSKTEKLDQKFVQNILNQQPNVLELQL